MNRIGKNYIMRFIFFMLRQKMTDSQFLYRYLKFRRNYRFVEK